MNFKHPSSSFLACALIAAAFLCGCDYPEAGYYSLVGLNHTGEHVADFPFMVEEITDDSTMTTGFTLYWPKGGTLVKVPVHNSEDITMRNWTLGIATEDTGAGSVDLSLAHFSKQLKFRGEYQAHPTLESWPVAGTVEVDARSTRLDLYNGLPYLHRSLDGVFSLELRQISEAEFEAALGKLVADALRVAQAPVVLEVVEDSAAAKRTAPIDPTNPPKPPTRGSGRGR